MKLGSGLYVQVSNATLPCGLNEPCTGPVTIENVNESICITPPKCLKILSIDNNKYDLEINESIYIPLGTKHRLENNTEKDLLITEVQIGDYLGEDDIIRYEDMYGRQIPHQIPRPTQP